MRVMNGRTKFLFGALALGVALALTSAPAQAKKPAPPPPPPPPALDTGAVYYWSQTGGGTFVMAPDGGDKAFVNAADLGRPSQALHDGKRWFLRFQHLGGTATYPDGQSIQELFAVDEDGNAYQLTDDALVEPDPGAYGPSPAWATDGEVVDGKVSFLGRTWLQNEDGNWYLSEWGLYTVTVDPDDLDDHVPASPTWIPVTFSLLGPTGVIENPDKPAKGLVCSAFDWSPDGTSFVYHRYGANVGIWRADPGTYAWTETQLTTDGEIPRWSAKDRIAFLAGTTVRIDVMDADGGNRATLVSDSTQKIAVPFWSPAGTFLVYSSAAISKKGLSPSDVYRVAADGSGVTNLSGDTSVGVTPRGWVGD